jgi:phytoene desaturase
MYGRQAAVIGSGVAGLAVAIRLAAKGIPTQVFEKNEVPGGKIGQLQTNGFHFDTGPSLFVQPENLLDLFRLCGEEPEGHFSFAPLEIACRYFFENGVTIDAYSNTDQFADELQNKLGEDPKMVKKYLSNAGRLYESLGKAFINHPIHLLSAWVQKSLWTGFTKARPSLLFQSLNNFNQQRFHSVEATQIFNRFATYNGSDPYRAPAMLSMIPHLEQNLGSYYPNGGMIQIAKSLYELACRQGVKFKFNAQVERIVTNNDKVKGIVVNGKEFSADIVVSNADIYTSYHQLLEDEIGARRISKQEASSSAAVFYWGMNKQFEMLTLHNIFFAKDYRAEFQKLFKEAEIDSDPTIYINISSKMDKDHAPVGKENWFVLINAPANSSTNWIERMSLLRANVIQKLERMLGEPVGDHIEVESTLDPRGIELNTGAHRGALYGMSSNSFLSAFRRHPNFSKHINGLYFCGGTVHPGGGIPLCLKSAEIVSNLVAGDIQKDKI